MKTAAKPLGGNELYNGALFVTLTGVVISIVIAVLAKFPDGRTDEHLLHKAAVVADPCCAGQYNVLHVYLAPCRMIRREAHGFANIIWAVPWL